jgi:SAM-dependent methyltransferase
MNGETRWQARLVCPIDHGALEVDDKGQWLCKTCNFRSAFTPVDGQNRADFRALDQPQTVTMSFKLPGIPLDRQSVVQKYFHAVGQDFAHYSRREIRKRFGTKLDKGIQYYCQDFMHECGPDAMILDLGCGNGGNRRYLESLGFRNVVTVDWNAKGADLLADAHRLPFADHSFQLILSTAVFEHLYNPFIAIAETGRVLAKDGLFVGGASFWEAWHGSSYFHLTPDGWNVLCQHGGLILEDLWSGWGIMPAALTHVVTPGHFREIGYAIQRAMESVYRLLRGEAGVRKLQLRASGAYEVCARKCSNPG